MTTPDIPSDAVDPTTANSVGPDENTTSENVQENQNISISANANIAPASWEGDPRYFQTGTKAGQLKPAHRDPAGIDAEKSRASQFNTAGTYTPDPATPGSAMPTRAVKKGGARKGAKAAPDTSSHLTSAVLYTAALDKLCRVISDDAYKIEGQTRDETIQAAAAYFEAAGFEMPPWAGLAIVTGANLTAAFATPRGTGIVSGAWNKLRGWWIARRA